MDSGGMDNFMEKVPLPGAMDPRTQEAMNMARKMVQEDSCILLERYTKVNGAMENKKARELCTMLIKTYWRKEPGKADTSLDNNDMFNLITQKSG